VRTDLKIQNGEYSGFFIHGTIIYVTYLIVRDT